jgi:hypothetical protein
MMSGTDLRVGNWVEVKSKEEILQTLDENSQLEGLPFMPEMLQFCGQRFQVFKRAHKTCDMPSGLHARRMTNAVHLSGLRCDGRAHGGCDAGCLVFWKEAWLKRVGQEAPAPSAAPTPVRANEPRCTEAGIAAGAYRTGGSGSSQEPTYVCQSTALRAATAPLPWWDPRQYLEDFVSGNVGLSRMLAAFAFFLYQSVAEAGLGLGAAMRWLYDTLQRIRGGAVYPLRNGHIPRGAPTPSAKLDLEPGELVRVRDYSAILGTLNQDWHNRGMYFDSEMVPFCEGTYRVLRRVEKIIDDSTGKLMRLKNEAIILDDVLCEARWAKGRHFCSRSHYPYWREIWLERAEKPLGR